MSRGAQKFELSLKRNGALPGFGEKKRTDPKSVLVKGLMEWTGVTTPGRKEAKKNRQRNREIE